MGNADGIGSRFFTIQNTGSDTSWSAGMRIINGDSRGIAELPVDLASPVEMKRGFDKTSDYRNIAPGEKGITRIDIRELEHIELHIPGIESGYLLAGE